MAPGTRLAGKYRLLDCIGKGGMGSVWRAERQGWLSPVAVKLINAAIADQPDAVARFQREARMAASLRSPHVVQVLDDGVDEETGYPFIVMELLEGEPLKRLLERRGRLPPDEVTGILTPVCRALARAHEMGIVHRDLKPDNIFLQRDFDAVVPKILDFGIGKWTRASLGEASTHTGMLMGTPYYMSPEQIVDSKSIDHRTDLWAMAVIAYECLTGYRPFEDDNVVGLAVKINAGTAPRPSSRAPVPGGFDELFATAIARDIDQRFQSALAFGERLRDICAAAPGAASALETTREPTFAEHAPPPSSNTQTWLGERLARRRRAASSDVASTAPVSRTNGRSQPALLRRASAAWVGGALLAIALLLGAVAFIVGRGGDPAPAATAAPSPAPEPPKPAPSTTEPPRLSPLETEPATPTVTVKAITEPLPAPSKEAAPGANMDAKPAPPHTKSAMPARARQGTSAAPPPASSRGRPKTEEPAPSAAPKPEPPKPKWNSAFD